MPEKKSYKNAIVRGFFIGIGVAIVLNIIVSTIWENFTDVGFILKIALILSVICSIIHTKMTNDEAEETYWREKRIYEAERERKECLSSEIGTLKREFDEGRNITDLVAQSQFKNILLNELLNKVAEYEGLYFSILKNPEITLERTIWGDICDPQTALNRITGVLCQNTVFWNDINDKWRKHHTYSTKLTYAYNCVSTILVQGQYGSVNEEQLNKIKGNNLNVYIKSFDEWYAKENTEEKLNFDYIFETMWKFAFEKPCNLDRFNLTSNMIKNYLYCLVDVEKGKQQLVCLDVILAELYVAKEFGEKVLTEKKILMDIWVGYYIDLFANIAQKLKTNQHGAGPCIELASGLKWMGLYEFEAEVLRKIVTAGLPLSDELQERLRFIENVGNDLKKVYDIEENTAYISLDYATLNWREDDFVKLFQTLAFESKCLKYALTIREWSKNILMENKMGLNLDEAFLTVTSIIKDEYITSVKCRKTEVQLLSEDGIETRKKALLIMPDKEQVGFGYIGLLLNVIGFGRNINLRIYTIFMPENVGLEIQKQQVLTLKKNTNPDIVTFENGLRTSVLKGMETYMNNAYTVAVKESSCTDVDIISKLEYKVEQLY